MVVRVRPGPPESTSGVPGRAVTAQLRVEPPEPYLRSPRGPDGQQLPSTDFPRAQLEHQRQMDELRDDLTTRFSAMEDQVATSATTAQELQATLEVTYGRLDAATTAMSGFLGIVLPPPLPDCLVERGARLVPPSLPCAAPRRLRSTR